MARKQVYSKSEHGIGDFVYVDLLPEVKRPRQFNTGVIFTLFFAAIVMYVLVFIPVNAKTIKLEELNSWNNDLKHEYTLIQQEFVGYEIDLDVIAFNEQIEELDMLRVDFNNLMDFIELEVYDPKIGGEITHTSYSAAESKIFVTVELTSYYSYNILEQEFLDFDWVISSEYTEPGKFGGDVQYSASFTLEVNPNVE